MSTVVIVPGFTEGLVIYQEVIHDLLRNRWSVYIHDHRGQGHSAREPAVRDTPDIGHVERFDDFVADLDAWITGEVLPAGHARVFLWAHSMGGAIAARYAMDHPERLTGLALVDAGGAPVRREVGGNLAFTLARIPGVNRLAFEIMPRSIIEKSLTQSVARKEVVTPPVVDRYWELARYPGNRTATLDRFGLGWQMFSPQQVAAIDVPTLVMWGERDGMISPEHGTLFCQDIQRCRLVTYPSLGHLPQEEDPDSTLKALEPFLAS